MVGVACSRSVSPIDRRPRIWLAPFAPTGPRPPDAARRRYQYSFTPNCICRGEFACDVICPKLALLKFCSGAPQIVRLKRLNASTRTSSRSLLDTRDRFCHAQVLRQVPRPAHVAVHPGRVAQLTHRLDEGRPIQVAVDERVEFVARDGRAPVGARHVRAVRAVEDRKGARSSSRRSAARWRRSGWRRVASRRGHG